MGCAGAADSRLSITTASRSSTERCPIASRFGLHTLRPDVRIYKGRNLVWRLPATPGKPLGRRATGLEDWLGTEPGNGHEFKLTDEDE